MRKIICHLTTVHQKDDDRIYYKECIWLKKFGYDVYLIAPGDDKDNDIYVKYIPLPKMKNRFARITIGYWKSISAIRKPAVTA